MNQAALQFEEPKPAGSFPTPRPFQDAAHLELRKGFGLGHRLQVVMAPTGAGKTYLALRVCAEALAKGKRVVFICDRKTLINQTSAVADAYGMPPHGIIQAQNPKMDLRLPFQIASAQTIASRGLTDVFDVVVVDECFVAGTMVATPSGNVRIEAVRCGDAVYTATGVGMVEAAVVKSAAATIRLRFSDGSHTECTAEHPVFTAGGWRKAGELEIGSVLVGIEGLYALWKGVQAGAVGDGGGPVGGDQRKYLDQAGVLLQVLRQEAQEPDEQQAVKTADGGDAQAHPAPADQAWRERTVAALATACVTSRAWRGMGGGARREDRRAAGLSAFLQSGLGGAIDENLRGDRRRESRDSREASTGPEEGELLGFHRVVGVSRIERASHVPVFNLRVSGHPSYFADGRLVHNCHTVLSAVVEFITASKAAVIGMSATPFTKGLGKIYGRVINAATMDQLTKQGVLSPLRVLTCTRPDMEGAKTSGGEWTQKAAEERELTIIGDVVKEWTKHAAGLKTIVFGPTQLHCAELVRQFRAAGVEAATFTAETDDETRAVLLGEYRKPDSKLRVLVSVEALAKGFDVPDVGCVCDCRPLRKSLSTFVQMIGRGLRCSPGKTECVLLDFSGNAIRFADDFSDVYFNGIASLDEGKRLDAEVRADEKKEPKACVKCGYSPRGKKCVGCGDELRSTIEHEAGEAREVDILGGTGKYAKDKGELYAMIATHARCYIHGNPKGWTAHKYRELTGHWPKRDFASTPMVEPSVALTGKLKSMQIAWNRRPR